MAYLPKAAAGLTLAALIGASAASQATIVQFQTVMGDFEVNLYDETTPETVANFLEYVEAGAYSDSFMHRSVPGFIVQGGGFHYDIENAKFNSIATNEPVINEPLLSNQRGTIAMAKLPNKPNSATNQWYFNLKNNSSNLDLTNSGYTVFGEVTGNGMAIIDAIAALRVEDFRASNGAFAELPLRNLSDDAIDDQIVITEDHLVMVQNIVVLDAAVDTAADLDPMPTTRDDSEPGNGGGNGGDSGGGGGSVSWLMLLGLLGAGVARRVSRER